MGKSLKREVQTFRKAHFQELDLLQNQRGFRKSIEFLNSSDRGPVIFLIVALSFVMGQLFNPPFMQWMRIHKATAQIIIDQRTSNLATIFSITLVVMGWLLTNISVRESVSFRLLFKKMYLYITFYFITSVTACLMAFSLLRDEPYVNLPNVVIAGTLLIIVALGLILRLFIKFTEVVDSGFLSKALSDEIMQEVYITAKKEITKLRSETLYREICKQMNLADGITFNTDLSKYRRINITPLDIGKTETTLVDIFSPKRTFEVVDIDVSLILKFAMSLKGTVAGYYQPLHIGSLIHENFCPFYYQDGVVLPSDSDEIVRKAFSLKPSMPTANNTHSHITYLNMRFLRDVKEGKQEFIKTGLEVYAKIFDLENKIQHLC